MKNVLISVGLIFSISSLTFASSEQFRGTGFSAPTVNGTSGVADPVEGEIVFDATIGVESFYGWDGSNWQSLAGTGAPAGPTNSGIVTSGPTAQTFGGDKVFNGSITPTGGIVGSTSGTPAGSLKIGEVLEGTVSSTPVTSAFANYATIPLTAGAWHICYEASFQPATGTTINSEVYVTGQIYNDTDGAIIAGTNRSIYARNFTALAVYQIGVATACAEAYLTGNKTFALRAKYTDVVNSNSGTLLNTSNFGSRFYAIRIN